MHTWRLKIGFGKLDLRHGFPRPIAGPHRTVVREVREHDTRPLVDRDKVVLQAFHGAYVFARAVNTIKPEKMLNKIPDHTDFLDT